jgi:hypothetical protein
MSSTSGLVDEQGWQESVDLVNEALERALAIHADSAKRLAKSGDDGIPVNVVLMNFETPPIATKQAVRSKGKKASRKA